MNIIGNVLTEIKKLDEYSQNIIFCDPPYNLGSEWIIDESNKPEVKGKAVDFMNDKWEGLKGSDLESMFNDFFRILKHGGYVVFAGQMRQAMAFQYYAINAGFDMIESIYSYSISNFPKALDVSKSLDKTIKKNEENIKKRYEFSKYIKETRIKNGISIEDVKNFFGYVAIHKSWESQNENNNRLITFADWTKLKELIPLLDDRYIDLIEDRPSNYISVLNDREIIGEKKGFKAGKGISYAETGGWNKETLNITAPSSDLAKKYNGIKSSICPLKQTTEVWFIYRKSFKHGTIIKDIIAYEDGDQTIAPSGLNIDDGRVPINATDKNLRLNEKNHKHNYSNPTSISLHKSIEAEIKNCDMGRHNSDGRYPAQLFLDGAIIYRREEIDLNNKDFLEFVGIDSDVIQFMETERALDYVCQHLDKFDVSKLLDEQSGNLKSGDNCIRTKSSDGYHGNIGKAGDEQITYGDQGGCSRILHNASFVIQELYQHIYYSKASGYERGAGCDNLQDFERFGAGNYSQSPTCSICKKTINGTNCHIECEKEKDYKIEYIRKEENSVQKNNHPTLKSLKLLYNIIQLFKTVDIEKMKILIPFSGVNSEKIAWLAHEALEENITAIELNPDYVEIGKAREKFWIDNNFFFKDEKIMQSKIKQSIEKDNEIKESGQQELF